MASPYIFKRTKGFRKSEPYLGKINTNLESNHLGRFPLLLSISKVFYLIIGGESIQKR